MITRIVKMTFEPHHANTFLQVFESRKYLIASFVGCKGVELLRDIEKPNVFFTYSKWKDVADLEKYRNSPLFTNTWAEVKPLFAARAEAWSVKNVE